MAMEALAIILIVLILLLVIGVPISYSIGISSLAAILLVVPLDVSVLTAAQRTSHIPTVCLLLMSLLWERNMPM